MPSWYTPGDKRWGRGLVGASLGLAAAATVLAFLPAAPTPDNPPPVFLSETLPVIGQLISVVVIAAAASFTLGVFLLFGSRTAGPIGVLAGGAAILAAVVLVSATAIQTPALYGATPVQFYPQPIALGLWGLVVLILTPSLHDRVRCENARLAAWSSEAR